MDARAMKVLVFDQEGRPIEPEPGWEWVDPELYYYPNISTVTKQGLPPNAYVRAASGNWSLMNKYEARHIEEEEVPKAARLWALME